MKDMGKKITGAFGLLAATALVAGTVVAPDLAAQQQEQVPPAAPNRPWAEAER